MSDAEIKKTFFKSSHYAVIGASKDQTKYGTKILKWYQQRDLAVTPVHPKEDELEGVATIRSLAELKDPKTTSVSIVTPPKVTKDALELAKKLEIPAIWLQPGTYNDEVETYVKENLSDRVIYDCVLVKGDGIRASL